MDRDQKEPKMNHLLSIPTCELVNELRKREAVKEVTIEPYQVFEVRVGDIPIKDVPDSGPSIILIIWD